MQYLYLIVVSILYVIRKTGGVCGDCRNCFKYLILPKKFYHGNVSALVSWSANCNQYLYCTKSSKGSSLLLRKLMKYILIEWIVVYSAQKIGCCFWTPWQKYTNANFLISWKSCKEAFNGVHWDSKVLKLLNWFQEIR